MKIQKYAGLDVHKDTTLIAIAEGDRTGEVRLYGHISSDLGALDGARSAEMAEPAAPAEGEANGCPCTGCPYPGDIETRSARSTIRATIRVA